MRLIIDQFLWGHSSRVCDISCSESGHVAYQIKGNHECSSMVANILPAEPTHSNYFAGRPPPPAHPPSQTLEVGSNAATWWQIDCLQTPHDPGAQY